MTKQILVIIPGLGDRKWLYSLVKPIWILLGFKTYIYKYGWNNNKCNDIDTYQNLINFIDGIKSTKICILGTSAGGTAAINILATRTEKILKVITVCSPYLQVPRLDNSHIVWSISKLQLTLKNMDKPTKNKILAIYSNNDQTVPRQYRSPSNIKSKRIAAIGHNLSIIFSMTILSCYLKRFFTKQ